MSLDDDGWHLRLFLSARGNKPRVNPQAAILNSAAEQTLEHALKRGQRRQPQRADRSSDEVYPLSSEASPQCQPLPGCRRHIKRKNAI